MNDFILLCRQLYIPQNLGQNIPYAFPRLHEDETSVLSDGFYGRHSKLEINNYKKKQYKLTQPLNQWPVNTNRLQVKSQ